MPTPSLSGLYFVVADMAAALAFYRDLGYEFAEGAEKDMHVNVDVGRGVDFAFGTLRLTQSYNPGWEQAPQGSTNALQFDLPTREAVDELYERMTAAGHRGTLAPMDAFWGSRYCELSDADGNVLGFHSPRDDSKAGRPPL